MELLIYSAEKRLLEQRARPFSIYTSCHEQRILNVPIHNPLLIFVLKGEKHLGAESEIVCSAGNFVFLSNHAAIDMRNIPANEEYLAVLIEFEFDDFAHLSASAKKPCRYLTGKIDSVLSTTVKQLLEWSSMAPVAAWPFRRKEMLQLLYSQGYTEVATIAEPPSYTQLLQRLIRDNVAGDNSVERLSKQLALSESTLRRRLEAEGTSLSEIRDRVRLGYGLHLLQTTMEPIGLIAERCGYISQSRFTDKFKRLFNITPSALRKTRLSAVD